MSDAVYHRKLLPVVAGKRQRVTARANHYKGLAFDRLDCAIASLRRTEAEIGYAFLGNIIDAYCHRRGLLGQIDVNLENSDALCAFIDLRLKALTSRFLLAMQERGYRPP